MIWCMRARFRRTREHLRGPMTITTETASSTGRSPCSGHADASEIQHWTGVAEGVAAELATDAVARDRANTQPAAQLELLRSSGLVNLLVPTELGGHGGHWETAFAVARIIARTDASIAQILGYHYLNQA